MIERKFLSNASYFIFTAWPNDATLEIFSQPTNDLGGSSTGASISTACRNKSSSASLAGSLCDGTGRGSSKRARRLRDRLN